MLQIGQFLQTLPLLWIVGIEYIYLDQDHTPPDLRSSSLYPTFKFKSYIDKKGLTEISNSICITEIFNTNISHQFLATKTQFKKGFCTKKNQFITFLKNSGIQNILIIYLHTGLMDILDYMLFSSNLTLHDNLQLP